MKELERLLELIKSGATQDEVNQFLRDNRKAIGDLTEPGALGDVIRQAGLTTEQSSTFNKAYKSIIVDPNRGIIEETALLGAGAGIGGLFGGLFAKTALVGTGTAARQVILNPQSQSLLAKAWSLLGPKAKRAAKLTIGATGAIALGSAVLGPEDPTLAPGFDPNAPGPGAPGLGADASGVGAPEFDPDARRLTGGGLPGPADSNLAPEEQIPGITPGVDVPPDLGFNIMVVDHSGNLTGTPGAIAVVSPKDLGLTSGIDPTTLLAVQAQAIATGTDIVGFLQDYFTSTDATRAASSASDREVMQILFPETIGDINIGSPFQAQPSIPGQRLPSSFLPTQIPANVRGTSISEAVIEKEFEDIQRTDLTTQPVGVPAGAKISPRVFTNYQGRTLLEWASISAQRYDVPLNLLYGIINHESGFRIDAVGDNGTSFGLAQLHLPAWPAISKGQALNPLFALEWTAQKLRERFNQYGRWDAAVAAHNSPQAAQHLARTGEFFNAKSANYTSLILNAANASGLASAVFDSGADLPELATEGPTFTPFQTPDPAQSREYIRGVYEDLLNRSATEDELITGVRKLEGLARSAYSANLRQAQGSTSQGVDIAAQFEEDVKGGGEFAFVEEVEDQSNFTDFASGVARLLQQGL